MGSYAHKILHLYPTAEDEDFRLVDDGSGTRLEYWNTAKLLAMPTLAELDTRVDDATANATATDKEKDAKFNTAIIKAMGLTFKDYINELRAIESLPPITNQELRIKVKSYLP